MKILVTGGAGFIGSNFIRRTLENSITDVSSLVVLDKLTYAGLKSNLPPSGQNDFEFVQGDICDQDLVDKVVGKSDVVINFAAESHVDRSITGSRDFILTNVLGTHTLQEAAKKHEVKTFIQVSTDEIYGSIEEGSSIESDPALPNSPYAASKASAELVARSYFQTYGLDVRITRSSNNYGRNQFPEKIIPLFITNLIDDLKVPIYGDGLNSRDWLHVDDNCDGIVKVLTNGQPGEIYNLGGGTELTNISLTKKILQIMSKDDSYIDYVPDRLGHDIRYSVDPSKSQREIGYSPLVNFDQGLVETLQWYIENQNWWRPLKK